MENFIFQPSDNDNIKKRIHSNLQRITMKTIIKSKFPVSKRYQVTSLSLAAAIAVTSQASGALISSQFESAAELTGYSQWTNLNALSTGGFEFTAASGRNGTGGLTRVTPNTSDTTAINTTVAFNLNLQPTTATLTLSQFFFFPVATAGPFGETSLQLGFSANDNTGFYGNPGHSFISGRLLKGNGADRTFQTQTRSGGTNTNATVGNLTIADNIWYKFSVSLTKSATANTFDHSMIVEDWGSTGATFVSTLATSTPGTFTNNELYIDTTAYAAFRSIGNSGITRFDSFEVIPEPSGFMLLGCSAIGLLVRRRR